MSKKQEYQVLATEILKAVGGKENVMQVTHCMTRLRFNLKDESIPNDEEIKSIKGVIGTIHAGGQLQIIIGQTVEKVYNCIREEGGFEESKTIDENLDVKKKITLKSIGNGIMDGLAGSLTPIIPMIMAASIFKMLVAVLGPDMLNVLSTTSDLYVLFTFVGDAGFYFFPVIVGYTASKKFGVTPVLGMFLGAIMLHPTFMAMAVEGSKFTVFGIPSSPQVYSSTILPIIMSVWVMSYVEKFFKKILPDMLRVIFAPTLTITVMLPIALCVLGPAGSFLADYVAEFLLGFGDIGGFLAIAIIAALWQFLVMSGMHIVMITTMILLFSNAGYENLVNPAACIASISVAGMCLGAALKIKNKEQKSLSFGYFITSIIGGVTEPGMYGIGMKYKRPFLGMMAGGFVGGLYAGLLNVGTYALVPVASFLCLTSFAGGPTSNLVHGIIASVIAFIVSAAVTYLFGFKKDEVDIQKQ
ncbi:PTS system beta-glucosides-specific IIC component [Breznakia sp. PF5-3]|uniref:PTS transporter subunit EIIC n=1 Tax=unclassified Breznakia TaxID=2623764 RepID=UPI002405983E|nr:MULTISPECIES: PTS transporter subunit EIIC [unclassified Breznakia]MDF9823971.1 PTS system beta-glucosides-specific IIC component [Breznakia sp. PM6-1]MDF9834770.1 PTS system beta-glucosides-specific IIC component [Breznakia sp. PF5-3]MDF9838378.1 PTS system beta-glucosides-specific IIC component [Breznakia sp. PFB2-8]MDF9860394.1 PTS system beta-glucosides-specific IIC component [Breznakia sp. PH5-24]